MLRPTKIESCPKPSKGKGNNFLSKTEVEKAISESSETCALVGLEENEEKSELPPIIDTLLHEFSDILPDKFPPRPPTMRDIQHSIDFIPVASLPNKESYRMNPKEQEELQKQVVELISKGLVRERMSPCAVSARLVSKRMVLGVYVLIVEW